MKCCVSTDVGTWTNWLTFEPDPDYSPDGGTGLLSPISYALQRGILLRRENPTYRYWAPVAAATRGFKMVFAARCQIKRGLSRHAVSVCVSVCICVSVTFVHSIKTNKGIFKIFPPSGSHTILVVFFHNKQDGNISKGTPLTGASNAGGVG